MSSIFIGVDGNFLSMTVFFAATSRSCQSLIIGDWRIKKCLNIFNSCLSRKLMKSCVVWTNITVLMYLSLFDSHWELRDIFPVHLQWQCDRPEYPHYTRALQHCHGFLQQQQQQRALVFPLLLHASLVRSVSFYIPGRRRRRPPTPRHKVHHSSECLIIFLILFSYWYNPVLLFCWHHIVL